MRRSGRREGRKGAKEKRERKKESRSIGSKRVRRVTEREEVGESEGGKGREGELCGDACNKGLIIS